MLEDTTRMISESLARAVDRRTFLKRTSQAAFVGAVSLATGHAWAGRASATNGGPKPPIAVPNCAPPGPYCNYEGGYPPQPDSCHGAHCYQHMVGGQVYQCRVYYQYYQAGCWTAGGTGGFWTCCDCECGTPPVAHCGCAQFSGAPAPTPDRPVGVAG